jgi:anti-sigma factor RsiW
MKNDPGFQKWRELSWRRKLTPAEEVEFRAWLATHPQARAEWEAEMALTNTLASLPDVPVASNFTARVLQAIEREETAIAPAFRRPSSLPWRHWLPRMALGALAVAAGLLSYLEVSAMRRAKLVQSVEVVSRVSTLPSPAILEDFDAIQRLSPPPVADEQLLSLLQ